MGRTAIFAAFVSLIGVPVGAAPREDARSCLDLRSEESRVTLSGLLTVQLFAGPPNYESIASGDAEEKALILELPTRLCAEDGEFIESSQTFDRVQLSSSEPFLREILNAAVGRSLTVKGTAFGAHTGHHHAPLVLFVEEVTVR